MPIHFRVHKDELCVHATGEDPLTDADLRQYQMQLAAHPEHGAGFHQLVDLREVSGLAVTSSGVREAGHLSDHFAEQVRGTRCAVVVATDVAFGMARMFEAYITESVDYRVFTDPDEAEQWIGLAR